MCCCSSFGPCRIHLRDNRRDRGRLSRLLIAAASSLVSDIAGFSRLLIGTLILAVGNMLAVLLCLQKLPLLLGVSIKNWIVRLLLDLLLDKVILEFGVVSRDLRWLTCPRSWIPMLVD